MDAGHLQKEMNNLQNSDDKMSELFGRIVSGRPGYRATIEKTRPPKRCVQCQKILEGNEKFCPDCGKKVD